MRGRLRHGRVAWVGDSAGPGGYGKTAGELRGLPGRLEYQRVRRPLHCDAGGGAGAGAAGVPRLGWRLALAGGPKAFELGLEDTRRKHANAPLEHGIVLDLKAHF